VEEGRGKSKKPGGGSRGKRTGKKLGSQIETGRQGNRKQVNSPRRGNEVIMRGKQLLKAGEKKKKTCKLKEKPLKRVSQKPERGKKNCCG